MAGTPVSALNGVLRASEFAAQTYHAGSATPIRGVRYTASGVTVANGTVVFSFPTGLFTAVHHISATVVRAGTTPTQCYLTAFSATGCTVQVTESATTTVLLLNTAVSGQKVSGTGITVTIEAVGTA